MLNLVRPVKNLVKIKTNASCIDNWVFKLHYRATTIILLLSTILVTSKEYIGDRIKCIMDTPRSQQFIETYCFFSSTFTVTNYDISNFGFLYLPHAGVVPYQEGSQRPIRKHLYYQWVPYVLFGQAMMFYVTHFIWKRLEDGRVGKILAGLTSFAPDKKLTKEKKDESIEKIKDEFWERITMNKSWARQFMFFEVLNLLNVVLQIYITDKFLDGQFYSLGGKIVKKGYKILDEIFPKVTKCTFHKYGHSGTIEIHDTICVMALNIVNEKIYVFLWFWFAFLFGTSCLVLVWRLVTIIFYSRSVVLNQMIFGFAIVKKLYPWHLGKILKKHSYCDWLFLRYLSKNVDFLVFKELFDFSVELKAKKTFVSVYGNEVDNKDEENFV